MIRRNVLVLNEGFDPREDRGLIRIRQAKEDADGALHLTTEDAKPQFREDVVRLAGIGRTPDLRYRGGFFPWAAKVQIAFNEKLFTIDKVVHLLQLAGENIGICEGRPEKSTLMWGTFAIESLEYEPAGKEAA